MTICSFSPLRAPLRSIADDSGAAPGEQPVRRDFLNLLTGSMTAVGVGCLAWPLLDSLRPAADLRALAAVELDLTPIALGQRVTITWRGRPVFLDHRTAEQIQAAQGVDIKELRDPESDARRAPRPEWLILVGICTHLGCVPLGQKPGDQLGDFGGWFCPCHGSHYDTSGRVRKGPAPTNLVIPPYRFLDDNRLRIG